jgi:hypothetical protein
MRLYNKGATYENVELLPWETDMLIGERDCLEKWIREEILPTMPARRRFVVDFGKKYKAIDSKPTTDFHLLVNAEPHIYVSEYPGIVGDVIIRIGVSKRYGWCPTPLDKVTDPKTLYALSDNWIKIRNELTAQLEKCHVREPKRLKSETGYESAKVGITKWAGLQAV